MTGISAVLLAGILADPAMLPRDWGLPIPVDNVAVVADAESAAPLVAALQAAGAQAERVAPEAALAPGGLAFVPAVGARTVVLVGGIHTNPAILPLYGGYLSFGDAAYPGEDNFVIRPVAAPFGPGTNAVVVEASSPAGCRAGAARLAELLRAAAAHRLPNVIEPHLSPGALQRFANLSTFAQRYALTGAPDAAEKGLAQVLGAANERGWFDAGDYGIERWVRDVQLLQDAPAGTPDERLRLDQALFTTCRLSFGLWWCRGDGSMIGGRHQTMGTSCIAAAVQLLRRRGQPNDEARALIDTWWAGTGAYWKNACTTFHDDLEGFPIYCSPEPTVDQAFAFGCDGYLREQLPLAALRVYAATDNQGFYAGTGTYEECRPGDVYKTMPWGWILSAAGYFQPGAGWDWLATHWPNAYPGTWGVGRQFGGARMFATGRDTTPPERLLGVLKVPLGPYRFAHLAHERNDTGRYTLVPEERCFEKICCRDNFSPDGQYLLLQGYQPIGADNVLPLDNNNLIRYDDLGHVWLHSNSEKSGNLHRSAVYCSDGLNAVPSPAAAELVALHSGPRLGLTATKLPDAGPCDWTRHLFWRRGRYFVLIDLLRANRAGQAALTCSFRTPQRAELLSDGMLAREGDAAMRVVSADPVRLSLDGGREEEGAAVPTLLRESRLLDGDAGATAVYRNLVYSADPGHPAALEARPLGDHALLVRGTARGEDELALLAVRSGDGPLRAGPFETDGVMLYAGSGGIVQAGGTVVKLNGKPLGETADAPVSRALEELWRAAKPAAHPGNAPAAGGAAKVLWRADPFTPLPDAAAAPVLTSTPPGVGQLGSLFDRIVPRGPTVTWPAGDVTLTLDLRETRPLRQIDFQVGQFGSYNTIPAPDSLPAPRPVEAELSNDGFQVDRRAKTLTFTADCTYENIHKGTVWPILRWTCAEVGGAARWVRLTFRAAAWPGALGLNELSLRPAGASAVRAVGAVLRDVDGDGAAELLTWSDQAELAALKLDGQPLWRTRLPGFITAAEAYSELGEGRRVLVTTREARLYCLDAAGNEVWRTDFLESVKQNTDLPIGYSIGLLKAPEGQPVIVVGNYNLASFVSASGQVLRYQRLPGAFQTMTLSRGIDADGDGVEELVSSEVWGTFSALDGRLALKKGIRLPPGKGVALQYWGPSKPGAAKVLVCTETGVGRLDLGTLAYDWLHGLSPVDGVALGEFDGGGELQAAVAKHDGWVLIYDGRGELRRKVLVGEPVRAVAAVPGAGGSTLVAALPGRLVRLRGAAVETLAAGDYDRLLAPGPAGEVLAVGAGGVVAKVAVP